MRRPSGCGRSPNWQGIPHRVPRRKRFGRDGGAGRRGRASAVLLDSAEVFLCGAYPAAHQRHRMSPSSRHHLTLRLMSRAIEIVDSHGLVDISVCNRVPSTRTGGGRPGPAGATSSRSVRSVRSPDPPAVADRTLTALGAAHDAQPIVRGSRRG